MHAESGAGEASSGRPHRRLSEVLVGIVADETRERVSVADLRDAMGDRAFGALMLIFALPNVLPTPPGMSTLLGAPLIFLAAQLTIGAPKPWLPRLISARSMSKADFTTLIQRLMPWLVRAERLLAPRFTYLVKAPAERIIGVICLLLAIILFLPIPLGNILPALSICLFSLGILERDGVAALLGLVATIVSLALVWGVLYALTKMLVFILTHAFSR